VDASPHDPYPFASTTLRSAISRDRSLRLMSGLVSTATVRAMRRGIPFGGFGTKSKDRLVPGGRCVSTYSMWPDHIGVVMS